jgi:hypothetical protein
MLRSKLFSTCSTPLWALALVMALASCEAGSVAPVEEACDDPTQRRPLEVSLAPGEVLAVGGIAPFCLEFPGEASEYVLAYLDRQFLSAPGGLPGPNPEPFAVEFGGAQRPTAPPATTQTPPAPSLHAPPVDLQFDPHSHADAAMLAQGVFPYQRDRPWEVGEETEIWSPLKQEVRTIRIEQIHDDYLVFASITGEKVPTLDWTLAQIDSARTLLSETGIPLVREAFPGPLPLTSEGSGHFLVLIHPELREERGAVGVMYSLRADDGSFRYLAMVTPNAPDSRRTPVSLGDLILHEITHAFQYRHHREHHGGPPTGGLWALEGGASLMQTELNRHLAGIGLLENHDWREPSEGAAWDRFPILATPSDGRLERGYSRTGSFLLDQIRRRVTDGDSYADALAAVSQGVLHGWRSNAGNLQDRQRELLGESWTPEEAILTWILSHAADDLTDSPVYQNQTLRNAWDIPGGSGGGWREEARIVVPRSQAHRSEHEVGSAGFVRLHISQVGGVVGVTTSTHPGRITWRLLRVR